MGNFGVASWRLPRTSQEKTLIGRAGEKSPGLSDGVCPPNLNLNKIIIPVTHKWQPTLSPNLIDEGDPMARATYLVR